MSIYKSIKPVAVIGSGPAGLMVATVVSSAGYPVQVFEKRSGLGRKILIAGSSGLNVSFDSPLKEFVKNYSGPKDQWQRVLDQFPPQKWLNFIESLGLETFRGTSSRYFVRGMKGSNLLKAWVDSLKSKGVEFVLNSECVGFEEIENGIETTFEPDSIHHPAEGNLAVYGGVGPLGKEGRGANLVPTFSHPGVHARVDEFSALCFCLGGGSWEKSEKPLRWPEIFKAKKLGFKEFYSANSGFKVDWSPAFLKEAEGQPLKGIIFHSKKGSRAGEIVITEYGLEGTPIYALGEVGEAFLDLKPSMNHQEILSKVTKEAASRENLSPIRRVKKYLSLSPAALALIFHHSPKDILNDLEKLVGRIKRFPILLKERQPLEEAISSSGGLEWSELNETLGLKRFPGVFAAGEMLDWDAPTGGFLIQGCVSLGYTAGQGILKYLES